MKPYKEFSPPWYTGDVPKNSYRSIFKWGDPNFNKIPKENLYKLMKEVFHLTDEDFKKPSDLGLEAVKYDIPVTLKKEHIKIFKSIVGEINVKTDDYSRLEVAYGQTMLDLMRLRKGIVENVPNCVICPEKTEEIVKIVDYCNKNLIPVYVYSGGSSVTRGVESIKGGITLDMSVRFNKVLKFNEIDQTITVQPGISGPDLEKFLNNAEKDLGAKRAYTCGHFPQSFEYSTVGGWVVTRGAGQNSTYYGKIEDIVISQEYVTPVGIIKTDSYPRTATGPDIDQIMMGSEGTFGILTAVTLKIFRLDIEHRKKFSFMFKNWDDAMAASREIIQGEFGMPSVFRISDPEETQMMVRMYGISDTVLDKLLIMKGFKENQKCLMLGFTDGHKSLGKNIYKNIRRICKKYSAMYMTGFVTESWEKGRFNDPYLRDACQDFNIVIDTLECTVNWSNMKQVHEDVRKYCHSRPNTIVTTHMSHVYPQGANLYFIFITPMKDIDDLKQYHSGLLSAIQKSGAAMSHHHGIGKMFAPWLEGQIGTNQFNVIKSLKKYFDPNNIMNPGGTLGLDLEEKDKVFTNGKV